MKKFTSARKYFADIGKNFMTPDILRYEFAGQWAVEVSKGKGLTGNDIYGVTAICAYTGDQSTTLSKLCNTMSEVEQHIRYLKR